jgi:hypothetical protein
LVKNVLQDWGDTECVRILTNIRNAATGASRLFIVRFVVPGPEQPHFSKLFDIHMMCATGGRERSLAECTDLLSAGG